MRGLLLGLGVAALMTASAGAASAASCGCRVSPHHRVAHAGRAVRVVATRRVAVAATRGRPVVDATGLLRHAQWDVEVVAPRPIARLAEDWYFPTPGQPGYEERVPLELGLGGVVTPPIALPVRRGYGGLK